MQYPSFKEALQFWLKLGFISFGGPAGQIAIMHEYLVEKKKWISESKFLHALNYCMLLPGPEAQQLATYIGWMLHGTKGGLTAGVLFVLPSMLILLTMSILYVLYGKIAWVAAMFNGLKPAVIVIVLLALIKIGKKSLKGYFHYGVALLAFIGIFFFNIPFPLIILCSIVLAILGRRLFPDFFRTDVQKAKISEDESSYIIHRNTVLPGTAWSVKRLIFQIVAAIGLWLLPFVFFFVNEQHTTFWKQLSVFFTKAALVTFGGAYAVLPYVAQMSVEKFHWLSELQMMDGLALGETTPGPLVIILSFVGFMAGYYEGGNSLMIGTIALLATTFYTFLPSFFFIFVGAPLIEKTQENNTVKEFLSVVSAAVVGVILNLSIFFAEAVFFPHGFQLENIQWQSVFWGIVSFVAMYHFNIGMIKWIFVSALFGVGSYLCF